MKKLHLSTLWLWASQVALLLFMVNVSACYAQPTSKSMLLALSKANHTLAIVDPTSLKVINRIPVGIDPHEVVASADGKTAYVCIYGGGSYYEINVIDLVAQKPLATIDTRPLYGPHDIAYVNGKVWFSAEGSKAVGRYDPVAGKLDWSMGTGENRTHMLHVTADAKKIYTTNMTSGTVSILEEKETSSNRHNEWSQTIIPTSKGSEGFDVTPDGRMLWTASSDDGNITMIDLASKKQAGIIEAKVFGANRLKFTPDGKQAFISSLRTGELTIIDVQSLKEIKRLNLGKGAAGILMEPNGNRAFVACSADNNVAVISLKTLEVTDRIDVGGTPDGLAWAGGNVTK